MSVVGGPVIRRIIEVSRGPQSRGELLRRTGLSPSVPVGESSRESVDSDVYYELLESVTSEGDGGLPFRYAEAIKVDDFGALGLGLKTASTVREALQRLARYILVLSDTLEYELHDEVGGTAYVMSRPSHRRGAMLANECALGAVVSVLRQISGSRLLPVLVTFRHPQPESSSPHTAFFGCPVRFDDRRDALLFSDLTLSTRTRLGDAGLSAFILATLDNIKGEYEERSLPMRVHSAVTDALPDGKPLRSQIARRLGMSERTLQRRLAESGHSSQSIANRAQREAAESLLLHGTSSLAEVAFLTGFSDQSAFSRAFKGWTGKTPLSFRESAVT